MENLDGKNVVLTGGSYGIGKELARALLREGANVFSIARNRGKLEESVRELSGEAKHGRRIEGYPGDVTDKWKIRETIAEIAAGDGGIDVLVNNAGIVIPGYIEELAVEDFEAVISTDYLGAVYCTKAAMPYLMQKKECAVSFTSSPAAFKGIFGYATYSPAKAALIAFAEALKAELSKKGMQVTVLCPPDTDTPGFREEKSVRPAETEAIAGSSKPVSAEKVAACFLRGFKKGKFMVICDFNGKLLYRVNSLSPRLTDLILDTMVAKGRRKTE